MTLTSTPPTETAEPKPSAAELARARRERRNAKIASLGGSSPAFSTHRITARQIPFVAVLVALLGAGLAGVLSLNTLTDEAGIRTNSTKNTSAAMQLQIEGIKSDIAAKSATPALAAAARALGLVPAGDAAILVVPTDGGAPTVVGTPTAVPDPVAVAAAAKAAADAAAAAAAAKAAADAAAAQAAADAAAKAAADQVAAQAAAQATAALQTSAPGIAPDPTATAADPNAAAAPDSNAAAPTTEAVVTTQGAFG